MGKTRSCREYSDTPPSHTCLGLSVVGWQSSSRIAQQPPQTHAALLKTVLPPWGQPASNKWSIWADVNVWAPHPNSEQLWRANPVPELLMVSWGCHELCQPNFFLEPILLSSLGSQVLISKAPVPQRAFYMWPATVPQRQPPGRLCGLCRLWISIWEASNPSDPRSCAHASLTVTFFFLSLFLIKCIWNQ